MLAAVTLDGKIARSVRGGSSWTSREDKNFLHRELDKCDLIIVGRKTYELAKKPLSKRKCLVMTRKIKGIKEIKPNITYVNPLSISPYGIHRGRGGFFLPLPEGRGRPARLRYDEVVAGGRRGGKVCILGGSEIYSYFLKHNLLDEIYLTVEPLVFGAGVPLFDIPLNVPQTFKLVSIKRLNRTGTIVLRYKK